MDSFAIAGRGSSHFVLLFCVIAIFCLQPKCIAQATLGLAVNPSVVNPSPTEKPPIFSDVTIWTAQTVGSLTLMSNYEGQRMFAMGAELRRHFHTIRHADASGNFGIVPVCVPSLPTAEGRRYHYGGGGLFAVEFEPRKQLRVQPYFDAGGAC